MLKLMKRSAVLTLAVASLSTSQLAAAGENGHPTLNAIGRYLGAGYSQKGYQTSTGPLSVVRRMHPASNYPSSRLLAPYHASGYAPPMRPTAFPQGMTISPTTGPQSPSQPSPPPKPVGPPPTWLEPYLDSEIDSIRLEEKPEGVEINAPSPASDASPSDREDILSFDDAGYVRPQTTGDDPAALEMNRYRKQILRSAERPQ